MIIHGDSLDILKTLDADSVDAVITDPPYGLSFMGKKWDYVKIAEKRIAHAEPQQLDLEA